MGHASERGHYLQLLVVVDTKLLLLPPLCASLPIHLPGVALHHSLAIRKDEFAEEPTSIKRARSFPFVHIKLHARCLPPKGQGGESKYLRLNTYIPEGTFVA